MENNEEKKQEQSKSPLVGLVEKNITALVSRQIKDEKQKPFEERIAERIGRFTGNLAFVYTHAAIYGLHGMQAGLALNLLILLLMRCR